MVSSLWNACAENDIENLPKLLAETSPGDREITDDAGTTALIAATKAGHVNVVRILLEHGVDPNHASNEGRPDQHTTDPIILQLLQAAQAKVAGSPMQAPPHGFDPGMQYWAPPPPPGMFGYYSGPPPTGHDGAPVAFYPPPPPPLGHMIEQHHHTSYGPGNLPPPDVARMIPCRFFPACRYGASCLFAHPQGPPGAYFMPPPPPPPPHGHSGFNGYEQPPPPGAYPSYFAPPPPGFHPGMPPPGVSSVSSPGPHDSTSPPPPAFSPVAAPPGGAFGPPPSQLMSPPFAQPMSPTYAPTAQPPAQHTASAPPMALAPQSPPQGVYVAPTIAAPVAAPSSTSPVHSEQVRSPTQTGTMGRPAPVPQPAGISHSRRASARRPSIPGGPGGRRPPCIFFPSGRCKNGDDCRFPHVLPDGSNAPLGFTGRSGPRQRYPHGQSLGGLDEKMASMALGDGPRGGRGAGGPRGGPHRGPSGMASNALQQRVPRADEFPTLAGMGGGSARQSPPTPVHAGGMTAAQVLQAPPPPRKDTSKPTSVNGSAGSGSGSVNGSVNGSGSINGDSSDDMSAPAEEPAPTTNGFAVPKTPVKLPISFAAVTNSVIATTPELSVSA